MAKCLNCGGSVAQTEGKRTKLYCDEACRKAFKRKLGGPAIIGQNPLSDITGQPLPDKQIKAVSGVCWCCGKDITDGFRLTICCGPCAWSGKAKAKRNGCFPPLLTDRTPKEMEIDLHSLTITGPTAQPQLTPVGLKE